MSVHPRISVNSLSSLFQTLPDDIAIWRELGVDNVGLISPKVEAVGWDATRDLVMDAGLRVSNVSTENHVITESLRLAAATGAGVVYACSGRAGPVTWEETAENFCKGIAPQAELAPRIRSDKPPESIRTQSMFCWPPAKWISKRAGMSRPFTISAGPRLSILETPSPGGRWRKPINWRAGMKTPLQPTVRRLQLNPMITPRI